MSELVTAFARRAFQPLFAVEAKDDGIRAWIEGGHYYFDRQASPGVIRLTISSLDQFCQFQLFDYARFAFSSFETLAHCKSEIDRPRALGWPLLKVYYSGFFGAHALIRATGQGIIRLENAQTRILSTFGQIYDPTFNAQSGNYHYRIEQNPDLSVSMLLTRLPESAGAHEAFWRQFHRFLIEFANDVTTNNEPDATIVISKIDELQRVLTRAGSSPGSWLSMVRNQLNYQHLMGVWFPYGAAAQDVDYVSRIGYRSVAASRLDYDSYKEVIKTFCAGSLFIAALSYELANSLVGPGTTRRTRFAQNWRRLKAETDI